MNILKLLVFIPAVLGNLFDFVDECRFNDIPLIHQIPLDARDFPCSTEGNFRSTHRPRDVNELKVGDIDIVGAIGDSLTAGFAAEAESLVEIFTESRGVSWSIGGRDSWEEGIKTFPNIVKKYNPNLKGMSINSTNAREPSEIEGYNLAITGSIARDIPDQANKLLELLGEDEVNWKHINIFIGGNDLCAVCKNDESHLPANYVGYIEQALHTLAKIPRTFVSIVNVINVNQLNAFATGLCPYLHMLECPCIAGSKDDIERVIQTTIDYHRMVRDLVVTFPTTKEFTVVLQPFMEHIQFREEPQRNLLSPDCFHFTQFTHSSAGIYLWNNLLEPFGRKTGAWNMSNTVHCPTETTLLQTIDNFIEYN